MSEPMDDEQTWCIAIASGQHVVPMNDSRSHELDLTCGCRPRRDEVYPSIVIHNAFDRREVIEGVEAGIKRTESDDE